MMCSRNAAIEYAIDMQAIYDTPCAPALTIKSQHGFYGVTVCLRGKVLYVYEFELHD